MLTNVTYFFPSDQDLGLGPQALPGGCQADIMCYASPARLRASQGTRRHAGHAALFLRVSSVHPLLFRDVIWGKVTFRCNEDFWLDDQ